VFGNNPELFDCDGWILQTTSTIRAPADTPVTETKKTQVVIVSTAALATVSCSWEASA
jgi:hypothetical protein